MNNTNSLRAVRRLRASFAAPLALRVLRKRTCAVTPLGPPKSSAQLLLPQAQPAKDFTRLQEIEGRAARVDDVNQLRNLQGIFGYYFDKAMWDDVADLFAEDGTIELGLNGVYAGKANIRNYLYSFTGGKPRLRPGEIMNHFQLSPVVTLADDGQSAKRRWRTIIQGGTYGKGSGGDWGEGTTRTNTSSRTAYGRSRPCTSTPGSTRLDEGGWTRAPKDSALRYGKSNVSPRSPRR